MNRDRRGGGSETAGEMDPTAHADPETGRGVETKMVAPYLVRPLPYPVEGTVAVPGSKSITARALVAATLTNGTSIVTGVLDSDDPRHMVKALLRLGVVISVDWGTGVAVVTDGLISIGGGDPQDEPILIDVGLAGTVARFLLPVAALGSRPVAFDGTNRMRERPMAPLLDALRTLGAEVVELGEPGRLPVCITGPIRGGEVEIAGDTSSQFLSGLLLAGPAMPLGLHVKLTTALVSRPYVEMTRSVIAAFGGDVTEQAVNELVVEAGIPVDSTSEDDRPVPDVRDAYSRGIRTGGGYKATNYACEPDASSASYVFAAAAITGSKLSVTGLDRRSLQGDLRLVDLLARMGCTVTFGYREGPGSTSESSDVSVTTVSGPLDEQGCRGSLAGLAQVDMSDMSDVAQTLAAVAVFADAPTRITGIGFIRAKETDRIAATVSELTRCGIHATEEADGLLINPGHPTAAKIQVWGDHRVAMSMALLGLRQAGIEIMEPEVVAKTFPQFFSVLEAIARLPRRTS